MSLTGRSRGATLPAMRVLFVLLLSVPAWSRHIIEGPIGEIAEATETVTRLDRELADPQTAPERRAQAQAARAGQVEQIANVAAAHPANAEVNIAAASNLVRVNEPARAELAAERAVLAAPQNPDGYLHRGQARMAQGKFGDAVKDFQAVLQRRPGDPVAIAGLKLSEGRGSVSTADPATPNSGASHSGQQETPAGASKTAFSVSEFDQQLAQKKRVQEESLRLYNASRIAQSAENWKEALDSASKALALVPDSRFMKENYDSILAASADAAAKAKVKKPKPLKRVPGEAEPMGSSDFLEGYLHYLGRSRRLRRVDFKDVDTSDVKVISFPEVAMELRKPARDATISIDGRRGWNAKRLSQNWLIGGVILGLRGELKIRKDCRWTFEGDLEAGDDRYDFNKGNRGFVAETLTAIGRNSPGKIYYTQIRGAKPIREEGKLESCP